METITEDPTCAPQIGRDDWPSHPRYPSQVLLLGSHENFRRINAYLISEAQADARPEALEVLYRRWISAMRSHEAYEEHKLYPYLARRWNTSFAAAEAGHRVLHEQHAEVLSAFARIRTTGDLAGARAALVASLQAHEAALRDHLQVEEDLVIPLLLSLSPEEFENFYQSSIDRLMRRFDEHEGNRGG